METTITKSQLMNNLLKNKKHKNKGRDHILVVVGLEYVHFLELSEAFGQPFCQIFHVTSVIASACFLVQLTGAKKAICFKNLVKHVFSNVEDVVEIISCEQSTYIGPQYHHLRIGYLHRSTTSSFKDVVDELKSLFLIKYY